MTERLQYNPDEFVLEDVSMVHYEVMDWGDEDNNNRGSVWMGIYTKDNKIYHLNISGENLKVYYSNETPDTSQSVPQDSTDPDGVL